MHLYPPPPNPRHSSFPSPFGNNIRMKITIDSYFGFTTAGSSKNQEKIRFGQPILETLKMNAQKHPNYILCNQLTKKNSIRISSETRNIVGWNTVKKKEVHFVKYDKRLLKMTLKLQKTIGTFLTVLFTSFTNALEKEVKLEKYEHSSANTVSVQMENL